HTRSVRRSADRRAPVRGAVAAALLPVALAVIGLHGKLAVQRAPFLPQHGGIMLRRPILPDGKGVLARLERADADGVGGAVAVGLRRKADAHRSVRLDVVREEGAAGDDFTVSVAGTHGDLDQPCVYGMARGEE